MRSIAYSLLVCFLLAGARAQQLQPRQAELSLGSATVGEVKGDVSIRTPDGGLLKAQRGQVLSPDSLIETHGGSILLYLEDESQVLVKSHSQVVLKAPGPSDGHFLSLLIGKLRAKIHKHFGTNPSFRMGTPTAVITVRGTEFAVDVTRELRTIVAVSEGLVEVAAVGAEDRPVLVEPGQFTQVDPNLLPSPPRARITPSDSIGLFADRNRPQVGTRPDGFIDRRSGVRDDDRGGDDDRSGERKSRDDD